MVQLADGSGNVTKTYDYDAFGNERNVVASDTNPWRYCGEYFDAETGTIYLRARYYNPATGRFMTEDSHWNVRNMVYGDDPLSLYSFTYIPSYLSIWQSSNLYLYCIGNPIRYFDSNGESAAAGAAIGALFGGPAGIIVGAVLGVLVGAVGGAAVAKVVHDIIKDDIEDDSDATVKTIDIVPPSLPDDDRVYQFAYVNENNEVVKFGPMLSFQAALNLLEGFGTPDDIFAKELHEYSNRYYKTFGMFTEQQSDAYKLAIALGSNGKLDQPKGPGYYPHYHDGQHRYHFWFRRP